MPLECCCQVLGALPQGEVGAETENPRLLGRGLL